MFDGVALNEVCCYDAGCNYILGLCCKHAHNANKYVTSLDIVKNVEIVIHRDEKKCCYSKDATVVVIGPYADPTHCHARRKLVEIWHNGLKWYSGYVKHVQMVKQSVDPSG